MCSQGLTDKLKHGKLEKHTMTLSRAVMVVFVVANDTKLVSSTVMASAKVVGLVSGPVTNASMPSFKLYSSSYDTCSIAMCC